MTEAKYKYLMSYSWSAQGPSGFGRAEIWLSNKPPKYSDITSAEGWVRDQTITETGKEKVDIVALAFTELTEE